MLASKEGQYKGLKDWHERDGKSQSTSEAFKGLLQKEKCGACSVAARQTWARQSNYRVQPEGLKDQGTLSDVLLVSILHIRRLTASAALLVLYTS